ncbi:MAG: glycosyltransferase family 39 protein [Gemmatimonadota bacterium]|nr:glycosyltransferase family 39 protein [Gemmatimonadota bacterium]
MMMRPGRGSPLLLLGAVLLVAASLRLYKIDQPLVDAFSWRQASTAMMADNFHQTRRNIFFPEVDWTGPGPNYQGREFQTVSYLSALLYPVLGVHDWIGRAVAVLFGLLGIVALFLLTRRVSGERHALLAAAVMAVLPGSIFVERSFLPDPAMVALVTTSLWLWVTFLQEERERYLWLAGAVGAWGFCSKLPGLIAGLPMAYAALSLVGTRKLLTQTWMTRLGTLALLTLVPTAAYYLWARHLSLSYPPYHFAGEGNWLWDHGLRAWLDEGYFLPLLARRFLGWIWTLPVLLLVLVGIAVRPPASAAAPWLFHFWLAGGVVFYLFGAKELVDNPWNFHLVNPAAAALAARGIMALSDFAAARTRAAAAPVTTLLLLLVILGVGLRGLRWMYHPYGESSRQMGFALRQWSRPGDLVVTLAHDVGDPTAIRYSERRGWVFPPARAGEGWGALPETPGESVRLLDSLRAEGADWLGIVEGRDGRIRNDTSGFGEYVRRTCPVRVQTAEWFICRLTPSPRPSPAR